LEEEADNLRAALAFAVRRGEAEWQVRLAVAQRWFWLVRGRFAEGREVFDSAAEAEVGPELHAAALYGAALFASHQGDVRRAKAQWQQALEIYQDLGDEGEAARCMAELGGVAFAEGDRDTARRLYGEVAEIFGRLERPDREAIALSNLAAITAQAGDLAASMEYAERACALQRDLGDLSNLAGSLINLASTLLQLSELDRARSALREAVELAEASGYAFTLAHAVAVAADLAATAGDAETAATLVGAAEAAFAAIGARVPEAERAGLDRTLAGAAAAGADALRLRDQGQELSLDSALALARRLSAAD
jgi:tetratricopeptide (TPR) repeat protein